MKKLLLAMLAIGFVGSTLPEYNAGCACIVAKGNNFIKAGSKYYNGSTCMDNCSYLKGMNLSGTEYAGVVCSDQVWCEK